MAPTRRLAIHRIAGHPTVARAAAEHLLLAALVDVTSSALHTPTEVRIVMTMCCLIGHWHVHVWRR